MIYLNYLIGLIITLCSALIHAQHIQIALIDTTLRTKESFHHLMRYAQALNTTVTHQLPDQAIPASTQARMVVVDEGLLTEPSAVYSKHVSTMLRQSNDLPTVILFTNELFYADPTKRAQEIAHLFGISDTTFFQACRHTILKEQRSQLSYSTLYPKPYHDRSLPKTPKDIVALPVVEDAEDLTLPAPLMLHFLVQQTPYFVGSLNHWMIGDFEDQRSHNPLSETVRMQCIKELVVTLNQITNIISDSETAVSEDTLTALAIECGANQRAKALLAAYKSAFGWTGLDFNQRAIDDNLQVLSTSALNGFWFELPMSRYRPGAKEALFEAIRGFTQSFAQAYAEKQRPRMFIENNLGGLMHNAEAITPCVDLYGRVYTSVPSPLDDEGFWKPLYLASLEDIVEHWHTEDLGSGVAIDGVIINLFLWQSKQGMNWYNNMVDFSDLAWNIYAQARDVQLSSLEGQSRIAYLLEHGLLRDYQTVLLNAAAELGRKTAERIRAIVPNAQIGVFCTSPLNRWFYQGFLKGLSSKEQPVLLFNNSLNFDKQRAWCAENDIYVQDHLCIPLSRFNDDKETALMGEQIQVHDGVWISKASRIQSVEPWKDGVWWSEEATSRSPEDVIALLNESINK